MSDDVNKTWHIGGHLYNEDDDALIDASQNHCDNDWKIIRFDEIC